MKYFPINLDIRKKKALVIGGGNVARRKVQLLLACGADVTVISPVFCAALARNRKARLFKRRYKKSDMQGACLVVSATDSPDVNRRVFEHATAKRIPVNVVDQPDLCTFTVPAVANWGELLITISTGGKSPAMARAIREQIEEEYGAVFAKHLDLMAEMRQQVRARVREPLDRARLLNQMAGKKVQEVIRGKGIRAARTFTRKLLAKATSKPTTAKKKRKKK